MIGFGCHSGWRRHVREQLFALAMCPDARGRLRPKTPPQKTPMRVVFTRKLEKLIPVHEAVRHAQKWRTPLSVPEARWFIFCHYLRQIGTTVTPRPKPGRATRFGSCIVLTPVYCRPCGTYFARTFRKQRYCSKKCGAGWRRRRRRVVVPPRRAA